MSRFLSYLLILIHISLFSQEGLQEQLDAILEQRVSQSCAPGITAGVIRSGKLIAQSSAGCMNLEYALPYNDSTVFGLASVTKQFTAACIGILESRSLLSVYDDVRTYIPELSLTKDTIRIQHLLNHTSGIRNHNVLLDLQGFDYAHRGYTNRSIEELMFKQRGFNNRPGEKMLYSNTNYVLLALIIERVSGQSIHDFAREALFTPLGMHDTHYRKDLHDIVMNRAVPYYRTEDGYKRPASLTLCVGAGGMASSIHDLYTWSQVFLDPDHEFSYLKEFIIHQDTLMNGESMSHARGMFISQYKGHTTYNHSGRGLGMRSQFICLPDEELAVVLYTNSEEINAVDCSYEILDLLIDGTNTSEETIDHKPSSKLDLNRYLGTYQELNSDLRMTISRSEDTLMALSSFGREAIPLRLVQDDLFSRADNNAVTYAFAPATHTGADLEVDFGGAVFYFEQIELDPDPDKDLLQYIGSYYSEELDVTYSLSIQEERLILNYPNNKDIMLREGVKDEFGANRRTKYSFIKDPNGKVTSFTVAAEGTVKDVLFIKQN